MQSRADPSRESAAVPTVRPQSSHPSLRSRCRRGKRSHFARLRRSLARQSRFLHCESLSEEFPGLDFENSFSTRLPKRDGTINDLPADISPGKSGQPSNTESESVSMSAFIDVDLSFFHFNVRGLRENLAYFDALIEQYHRPNFVAVTESWLTKATNKIGLSGYHLVSRLDRRNGFGGGIALFALDGYELSIAHVADSPRGRAKLACGALRLWSSVVVSLVPTARLRRNQEHTTIRTGVRNVHLRLG